MFILCLSCGAINPSMEGTTPVDHSIFDALLKTHVDPDGNVDYKALLQDSAKLNQYLKLLSDNPPNARSWTPNDQLAYWINAYNAFTLQLIINHYPVKSIKDIGSKIQIPFVNTPWDIKFIRIGDKKYDLNNIEHNILRKNFNEPRIHFAIVCASFSCPKLRQEAYVGTKIEQQLTEQAKDFLANKHKNMITAEKIKISKIFSWFKGDFTENGSLTDFLNRYAPVSIQKDADVSFMDYNWILNEQLE